MFFCRSCFYDLRLQPLEEVTYCMWWRCPHHGVQFTKQFLVDKMFVSQRKGGT